MAYIQPPWFTRRVFNPLAMKFGLGGAVTLAVAGRKSGKLHLVPVIPVEYNGARYLVSPRGETEWVRNLRAAGAGELRRKGTIERFTATEVPVEERSPILEAYRRVAGGPVESQFKALPDPADHPVFRIEPRTT
jgi:deazaflavin-dependent oxidoreductase (nitroreductase family)